MNRKADERLLSIYLFVIYIIVSIGIVSGVFLFYGSPLDVRKVEAGVLSNRVIDCLAEQGRIRAEVFRDDFDLVKFCNFNFKDNTQKSMGEEQYAVKVGIFDFEACQKILPFFVPTSPSPSGLIGMHDCLLSGKLKELTVGRTGYLELCFSEGDKVPKCNQKVVYLLNKEKKIWIVVTSVIGKV
jgi:hypothetical protein